MIEVKAVCGDCVKRNPASLKCSVFDQKKWKNDPACYYALRYGWIKKVKESG